jgi:hypothetical protein
VTAGGNGKDFLIKTGELRSDHPLLRTTAGHPLASLYLSEPIRRFIILLVLQSGRSLTLPMSTPKKLGINPGNRGLPIDHRNTDVDSLPNTARHSLCSGQMQQIFGESYPRP